MTLLSTRPPQPTPDECGARGTFRLGSPHVGVCLFDLVCYRPAGHDGCHYDQGAAMDWEAAA